MRVVITAVTILFGVIGCNVDNGQDVDQSVDESHLRLLDGDRQSAHPGSFLNLPVRVDLVGANPNTNVTGVPVQWQVIDGGGTVSSATTVTDGFGISGVQWRVGAGARQRLRAMVNIPGVDTAVVFSASVLRLQKVSGDSQRVLMTGPILPLVVSFKDAAGMPVTGAKIRWRSSHQSFDTDSATFINSAGQSGTSVSRGSVAHHTQITAWVDSNALDSVRFTVFLAHRFRVISGDSQVAEPGARLPLPIISVYEDSASGDPGPSVYFQWRPTAGSGSVDEHNTRASHPGDSVSNGWVLGPQPGVQQIYVTQLDHQFPLTNDFPHDTVVITAFAVPGGVPTCGAGGTLHDGTGIDITTSETWTAAGNPHLVRGLLRYASNASLTIEPGVLVCVEPGGLFALQNRLYAVGTPANPITFTATDPSRGWEQITLQGPLGTPLSEISNARIEYAGVAILATTPVRIDSTVIRQSRYTAIHIQNNDTTNRVYQTTVDTTGSSNSPAVVLIAPKALFAGTIRGAAQDALLISADSVRLQDCDISGSVGVAVGISVFHWTRISNCNITGNAGLAVSVPLGYPVDARSNWWGTAAGPASGGPNGVDTDVDASGPLSVPAVIGYRPSWVPRRAMSF